MADPALTELMRRLRRERIERARRQHPIDKMLAGVDLHDTARRMMTLGVRAQYPGADDTMVERIVRRRLAAQQGRDERR